MMKLGRTFALILCVITILAMPLSSASQNPPPRNGTMSTTPRPGTNDPRHPGRPQQTRSQVQTRIKQSGFNCNITSPNGEWIIASVGQGAEIVLFRVINSTVRPHRVVGITPTQPTERSANGSWVRRAPRFDRNHLNVQWNCGVGNFTNVDNNSVETTVLGASASMSTMIRVMDPNNVTTNVTARMTASVLEATTYSTICKPNDPSNCTVVELPIGLKFSLEFDGWPFKDVNNHLEFGVQMRFPKVINSQSISQTDQSGGMIGTGGQRKRLVGRRKFAVSQGVLDNPIEASYSCPGGSSGFAAVTTTGRADPMQTSSVLIKYQVASGIPSGCVINYDPVASQPSSATPGNPTTTTPAPGGGSSGAIGFHGGNMLVSLVIGFVIVLFGQL